MEIPGERPVSWLATFADPRAQTARQVADVLDRHGWDKTAQNQSVCQQIGKPCGVVHIALPPWDVANVHRVDQNQREVAVEQVPHRFPVDARGFHRNVRDRVPAEPRVQVEQPTGRVGTVRCSRVTSAA